MTIDRRSIGRIIADMKSAGTDTQDVEVKESVKKLPASLAETLSAFSNATGGTLILGLSEINGFVPAPGFRAKATADALASMCIDKLVPPVRPEIQFIEYGGAQLVVAYVPECILHDKPCYVADRGVYYGSYTRVSDGDRQLSSYEVDRLLENRHQPAFDTEPVEKASMSDLDPDLVKSVLERQRQLHPRIFADMSDEDALVSLHVAVRDEDGRMTPTLAGLLALGTYPQSIFPRLTVAFTAYSDNGNNPTLKPLDAQTMAGPLPAVLEDTLVAIKNALQAGETPETAASDETPDEATTTLDKAPCEPAVTPGEASNEKALACKAAPAFPLTAVQEAVANALMHRDYSPASRGTAVQVNLYPDRLEVTSPAGLYGTLTVEDLGKPGYSSTRNQFLLALLESVPYRDGYMVQNRGMGYRIIQQELEKAGMPQPEINNSISMFTLVMRRKQTKAPQFDPRMDTLRSNPQMGDALLEALSRVPEASAADLAAQTGMPRSTISYRLRKLESQGLIERIGEVRSPKQRYRLAGTR